MQSVVIDPVDRLWILDTGRVYTPDGKTLVQSSFGGPKLISINLSNKSIIQTILFPPTVAYPDSYLNDVRFDLYAPITDSGKGVAYITDSSSEGRNGLIVVDLGTGESWRHVSATQAVRPDAGFVGFVNGQSVYYYDATTGGMTYFPFGSDGIALSVNGENLFFCPLSSRRLYSVPTALLRNRNASSELRSQQGVVYHGEKGFSDGFETDSNGLIYMGNFEQNAVVAFNPYNGTVNTIVRDPRINWVDTCKMTSRVWAIARCGPIWSVLTSFDLVSVSTDGFLYFTSNQIHLTAASYPGTDRRVKPYALFKVRLPNGGKKLILT